MGQSSVRAETMERGMQTESSTQDTRGTQTYLTAGRSMARTLKKPVSSTSHCQPANNDDLGMRKSPSRITSKLPCIDPMRMAREMEKLGDQANHNFGGKFYWMNQFKD